MALEEVGPKLRRCRDAAATQPRRSRDAAVTRRRRTRWNLGVRLPILSNPQHTIAALYNCESHSLIGTLAILSLVQMCMRLHVSDQGQFCGKKGHFWSAPPLVKAQLNIGLLKQTLNIIILAGITLKPDVVFQNNCDGRCVFIEDTVCYCVFNHGVLIENLGNM